MTKTDTYARAEPDADLFNDPGFAKATHASGVPFPPPGEEPNYWSFKAFYITEMGSQITTTGTWPKGSGDIKTEREAFREWIRHDAGTPRVAVVGFTRRRKRGEATP